MFRSKINVSFLFLLIIASIGTVLRGFHFLNIPFAYSNLMHAHSHIAFQGWIYTALFLLSTHLFLTKSSYEKGNYLLQFRLTIVVLIFVLISFSLFGYGLYSIIASTLFQLLNYWLFYRLIKDTKHLKKTVSLKFLKTGIYLGLLSNIAPYVIGILSAKGFGGSEYYQAAIYFFLHFQYNGWFLFILFATFFKVIENKQVSFSIIYANKFYLFLLIAVIPALGLSYLGFSFRKWFLFPSIIAGILQIVAIYYLIKTVVGLKLKWIIHFALFAFIVKVILQLLSVLPIVEDLAFNNRAIIIAFMHLSLIGVLSFMLIGILFQMKWIINNVVFRIGMVLLIIGFTLTELILVLNGFTFYQKPILLFLFSLCMVIGIFLILISNKSQPKAVI